MRRKVAVDEVVSATSSADESTGSQAIATVIGPGITVKGDIRGASDLVLWGSVDGDLKVEGSVLVRDGAKVVGNISASRVAVAGEIRGRIEATRLVELLPSSKITGEIYTDLLSIAAGAVLEGKVQTGNGRAEEDASERTKMLMFDGPAVRVVL